MIARVNPDGTWTAMTLEAALAYAAENPYVPMMIPDADTRAAYTQRLEQQRAVHGVRPATPDEHRFLEEWKRLRDRQTAATERGWMFSTFERAPGAAHVTSFGDPQLASQLASMSILHQAELPGQHTLTDLSLPRLLDRVEDSGRAETDG